MEELGFREAGAIRVFEYRGRAGEVAEVALEIVAVEQRGADARRPDPREVALARPLRPDQEQNRVGPGRPAPNGRQGRRIGRRWHEILGAQFRLVHERKRQLAHSPMP